jgi:copper chaperone CopZ
MAYMNGIVYKKVFFLFSIFFLSIGLIFSQNPRKLSATIKSSVECEFCKKNVEKNLAKVKGIKNVKVDFSLHEIKVVYNSKKISLEEIKKAIADLGYDADEIPANNRMNRLLKHKNQNSQ